MPVIEVFEQSIEVWNLRLERCVSESRRASFYPIEDTSRLWKSEGWPMHTLGRGGTVPIRVRIPLDAVPDRRPETGYATLRWKRNPIVCNLGKRDILNAGDVLKVARLGLKADNGDTFSIEVSDSENEVARDDLRVCPDGGGDALGADGRPLAVGQDRREAGPVEALPPGDVHNPGDGDHRGRGPLQGAEDAGSPAGRPAQPAGGLRLIFDDLVVVAPLGSELLGDEENRTLKIGTDGQALWISWGCLPGLAKLGKYRLKAEVVPKPVPESNPPGELECVEPPKPHRKRAQAAQLAFAW
jgi:hypothetical protein